MSNTQKVCVIACIPKPNKSKLFLLETYYCIYKFASRCIANRIKKVLDTIIAKDQTGFIKGRYRGEKRERERERERESESERAYDIMYYTETLNIPGMLLLIDFEKALDLFNFKISIKNWIGTLYNNSTSRVLQN